VEVAHHVIATAKTFVISTASSAGSMLFRHFPS
jgi:hypothetical protein